MKLFLDIKDRNNIALQLKDSARLIDEESLTISQGLDTLLIRALDNIISRNRIDRLSLNNLGIMGKIDDHAIWGMILETVKIALAS